MFVASLSYIAVIFSSNISAKQFSVLQGCVMFLCGLALIMFKYRAKTTTQERNTRRDMTMESSYGSFSVVVDQCPNKFRNCIDPT